ncbi:MAG TPA: response regulator [bacterium]|nr:response regulator [bacterium]
MTTITRSGPIARIAICEDEYIVALDIQAFLKKNGYEVSGIFASAEDLLASMDANRPDLVLMDIYLQGAMDGIEASSILNERWDIPVILLTAYNDNEMIERAKLTQPYAYILKPYDPSELRTALSIGLFRAAMERRLRTSEQRYRGLFEDGIAAAFLVGTDGAIMESNRAFKTLAPGAGRVGDFFADDDDAGGLLNAIRDGTPFRLREVRVRHGDGRDAWALFNAVPIRLSDGTAAYQCQAVDVTERRTLLDQVVHAQKLSTIGRFAGGVAHDFNNVLTAVLGYVRLLRSDFEDEGRSIDELDGIEQAARRAAALSRQILVFSRRDDVDPTLFRLSGMLLGLEKMLKRVIGDGAALVVRADDTNANLIRADRTRIEQAVVNLVANSRDATPVGGRILVAAGTATLEAASQGVIGPIPAGTWGYIEVEDEGTGIDPAVLPQIFEPFFTTKSPERGTGLGLSTVMSIMKQAGGHIVLTSRVGAGTTVRLLFPLEAGGDSPEADLSTQHASRDGRNSMGSGRTVLLVETDDSVRAILQALLDRAGYRVVCSSHPGEALLLAEKPELRPDILVSDMTMPLLDGPGLAMRLRASIAGLPALFLRSHEGEGTELVKSPIDACLEKPCSDDELLSSIDKLLQDRMVR